MAFHNIQRQRPLVFLDDDLRVVAAAVGAVQPTGDRAQTLERTHARVGALEHALSARVQHQRFDDVGFESLGAGRQKLRDQRVVVTVDDQTWQSIGFTVYESNAVARHLQTRAHGHSRRHLFFKKCRVYPFIAVETPNARAYARARTERSPTQKLSGLRFDPHGFARVAAAFGDGAVKHPGVIAQGRTFFTGFELYGFHVFFRRARGCAAS